jgi:hypothetical protein
MRARLILPVVVIAVVAVIAGCGSSSNRSSGYASSGSATTNGSSGSATQSPAAYVKAVCTTLGPVVTDLKTKQAALASATTPQDAKAALQDFVSTLSTGLGNVIPQLQTIGAPNIADGSTIQSALVSAFTQLKTALAATASQIGSLPTNDPAAFKAGAQTIANNLRASTAGIKSSLQGLQTGQLKSAAAAEPACTALKSTS